MAKNSRFRVILAWLTAGLVTIEVLVILAFVPSMVVAHHNEAERQAVVAELGANTESDVLAHANFWFNWTLVKPGFYDALNDFILSDATRDYVRDNNGTQYAQDRVATFWHVMYAVYYRVALIFIWLPYLLPLIAAAFIDSIQARKVRQHRFSYVSPMTRSWAKRVRFSISCLMILTVLLPVHIPSMIYPLLLTAIIITFWVSLTNLQKKI